jgi:hypothetical protein
MSFFVLQPYFDENENVLSFDPSNYAFPAPNEMRWGIDAVTLGFDRTTRYAYFPSISLVWKSEAENVSQRYRAIWRPHRPALWVRFFFAPVDAWIVCRAYGDSLSVVRSGGAVIDTASTTLYAAVTVDV